VWQWQKVQEMLLGQVIRFNFIRLRRIPRLRAETPMEKMGEKSHSGVQARALPVDAVGHSLWRRTMNA
jgi:hypothetical protein